MGLRVQATADAKAILENEDDFGWPITITDPSGTSADLVGFSQEIHAVIDPDTGVTVSGLEASVVLSLASLTAAGLDVPKGIPESTSKPWVVVFNDADGNETTWKVAHSKPDNIVGIVVLMLEPYTAL